MNSTLSGLTQSYKFGLGLGLCSLMWRCCKGKGKYHL